MSQRPSFGLCDLDRNVHLYKEKISKNKTAPFFLLHNHIVRGYSVLKLCYWVKAHLPFC